MTDAALPRDRSAQSPDRRPNRIDDFPRSRLPGFPVLILGVLIGLTAVYFAYQAIAVMRDLRSDASSLPDWAIAVVAAVLMGLDFVGLTAVGPNEAVVTTLLGTYSGTLRDSGFFWINPFCSTDVISLALTVSEAAEIKVNDFNGNPIEVGTVVTWSVVDPAQAYFGVDDYAAFVSRQSETATRSVASRHPYETYPEIKAADGSAIALPATKAAPEGTVTLLGHEAEVSAELAQMLGRSCEVVGVAIHSVSISRLSYAAEIAPEMLQRQKALARVSAQGVILESATILLRHTMTELAKDEKGNPLERIDPHQAYAIAGQLLAVMVSGQAPSPVFGVGAP